jgi:hypothetical protein
VFHIFWPSLASSWVEIFIRKISRE